VMKFRVAPVPRSSDIASDEAPGCPEFSSSGPGWWFSKLPWISHLPVAPSVNLRVAPNPRSSGPPTDRFSRLPRNFDPSAVPIVESPGCPESPSSRLRRRRFHELPRFRIYGWVDDESPSVLELCIPWQANG